MLFFILLLPFYIPAVRRLIKIQLDLAGVNNYWCNLLNTKAINGQYNPAKPVAIAAMFILCFTLSLFWILFPRHIQIGKRLKFMIQISGILSMIAAFLLLSNTNHDLAINIASSLGTIATICTFIGLYKNKLHLLFAFGLFIILLIGWNNYVYYSKVLIIYLPVIQKVSFAAFLIWICCIDIILYRRS